MKSRHNLWTIVGLSLALILLLGLTLFPLAAYATPLPPRNPPPSIIIDPDVDDNDEGGPLMARIVLQGVVSPAGWGMVQWQDSAGDWQDVEGWQGPITSNREWTVLAKDFGTGPFRWVVRTGSGGTIMSESASFNLPDGAGETVMVTFP